MAPPALSVEVLVIIIVLAEGSVKVPLLVKLPPTDNVPPASVKVPELVKVVPTVKFALPVYT